MEQTSVFDIIRLLSDKKSIEKDLSEIKRLTSNYFRQKYFNKLTKIISSEITRQKTNPSDDLRLLYALKPYAASDAAPIMDNIIEAAAVAKAITNIKTKIPNAPKTVSAAALPSVNPDGVYDIDQDCLSCTAAAAPSDSQNIIFILALLALFIK